MYGDAYYVVSDLVDQVQWNWIQRNRVSSGVLTRNDEP